ncbi:hypothetical protein EYF80_001837 [Liparis tanakae]|uniref:Uncharacterized protein n=1 Tax=Liparis tanakae TaxID=230148 RepID=A0A4Z2JDN8_9TELE|nr:hypothetical protein EYF80_001837 [Liparis tanakae]
MQTAALSRLVGQETERSSFGISDQRRAAHLSPLQPPLGHLWEWKERRWLWLTGESLTDTWHREGCTETDSITISDTADPGKTDGSGPIMTGTELAALLNKPTYTTSAPYLSSPPPGGKEQRNSLQTTPACLDPFIINLTQRLILWIQLQKMSGVSGARAAMAGPEEQIDLSTVPCQQALRHNRKPEETVTPSQRVDVGMEAKLVKRGMHPFDVHEATSRVQLQIHISRHESPFSRCGGKVGKLISIKVAPVSLSLGHSST